MTIDPGTPVTNRRRFIQKTLSITAAALAARPTLRVTAAEVPRFTTRPSPDAALQALVAGNRRFVANQLMSSNQDLKTIREGLAEKQHPIAAVLGCADSRVPVELVFDQPFGQLFVTRVAGNIAAPDVTASLEYAIAELGVSVLLVLGHTGCGAVSAAMKRVHAPGAISSLYPYLYPAIERSGGSVDAAVQANAQIQMNLLRASSPVVHDACEAGTVKAVSGVYDLHTGRVTLN